MLIQIISTTFFLQSKHSILQRESNANVNALQQDLEELRKAEAKHRDQIRNLEIYNAELEQSNRVTSVSADDFHTKYNQLMERSTLLEQELENKSKLEEEIQRLRDELRGTVRTWL